MTFKATNFRGMWVIQDVFEGTIDYQEYESRGVTDIIKATENWLETDYPAFQTTVNRTLDKLEGTDINRADLFITNIVKCRPPQNRTPKVGEVNTSTSNYLFEQIELLNPKLIVLLGGVAAKKLLGVKSINEARGRLIEHDGRYYLVGYHPAVRFYREDLGEKVKEDFSFLKMTLKELSLG